MLLPPSKKICTVLLKLTYGILLWLGSPVAAILSLCLLCCVKIPNESTGSKRLGTHLFKSWTAWPKNGWIGVNSAVQLCSNWPDLFLFCWQLLVRLVLPSDTELPHLDNIWIAIIRGRPPSWNTPFVLNIRIYVHTYECLQNQDMLKILRLWKIKLDFQHNSPFRIFWLVRGYLAYKLCLAKTWKYAKVQLEILVFDENYISQYT